MTKALWPNTPVNSLQTEIWRRVGASDWNLAHPDCRARSILALLDSLIDNSLLEFDFSVLDLFCGDAVVLTQIKKAFPGARCTGVDLRVYPEHDLARRLGVVTVRGSVQAAIANQPPERVDVAILLNTWRGWDRAGLEGEDADLPERVESWLVENARYLVVTATGEQRAAMRERGWWLWDIGKGEDDSRMICAFWSGAREEGDERCQT
jgi:hypothetical protein